MAIRAFRSAPAISPFKPFRLRNALLHVAILALLPACSLGGGRTEPAAPPTPERLTLPGGILLGEELRPVDVGLLGRTRYDLPVEANTWVETELEYLLLERKDLIERWIARGEYYREYIEGVLREHGLPTDLYHLAMIESGFLPTARSPVGAAGMWQFMPATAGDVGLRVDRMVDERLDPIRATRAAARHLSSLHRIHGDWALATAAYNAGSGRISRGLSEFAARDFWDLAQRGNLAEETRQYVPRLYAVTILARDQTRFGLNPDAEGRALAFDSIFVEYETPLSALAGLGTASVERLAELNPHLVQGTVPGGGYWVWVPSGTGPELQRAYLASNIRAEQGLSRYTVRWGDTLSGLAQSSGVSANRIRELNPSVDFDRLMTGAELRLPRAAVDQLAARQSAAADPTGTAGERGGQLVAAPSVAAERTGSEHRVREGESLWTIARQYGLSVEALREANGISGEIIVPGQRLVLPPANGEPRAAEPIQHRVEPGDTLWDIAREYGSSVEAIQNANDLGGRPIRPGQVLTVPR